MNTRRRHRLLCTLLLLPLTAAAQPLTLRSTDGSEIGIDVSSYRYRELNNGAFFMSTEGNKVGIAGSFQQALHDNWFWGADARQAHGNVSYGSASSGSKGSNPDIVTEVRITGGKDHPIGRQVLAPYFGLGYRSLSNDLRGTTTSGAVGYRRLSEYTYVPLGLTHRALLGQEARISTTLEYDLLLEGRQQSYLSDADPSSNDPINAQRRGYGLRLIGAYETYHWSVGAFFHYWNIADSDQSLRTLGGVASALVMEPQNTTRELGVRLRLRFH